MKLTKILLPLSLIFSISSIQASEKGEELFNAKCQSCHIKTVPTDFSKLVAPPVFGVVRHVKMQHKTKAEAVKFISTYTLNPQRDKAVCMPQKIKRFGLMPSQKGNVTENELKIIASWMYDNFAITNSANVKQVNSCNSKNCKQQNSCNSKKSTKANKKASPFLITKGMPHLTRLVKISWNDKTLNLTKEQKEKLLVVRNETMQSVKRISPKVKQLEQKVVFMTMNGEKLDRVYALAQKLSKLKLEATKVHIRCIHKTQKILTPLQLQYLLKK